MSDERLDALAETARNRGLKLVRSRVRTPGKRRFGKVGLTDASGKPVLGMDAKGPTATPDEVEDYLRNLGAKDWGASLDVAVLPRKRKPKKPVREVANDTEPEPAQAPPPPQSKPERKAKAEPKAKPEPKPKVREAKAGDAPVLVRLIRELGHEIDETAVRKNLPKLKKADELPLVVTLGKEVTGLCGIHRMFAIHRDKPVGRVNILIVAKEARRKGLGRMLVEAGEERLRKLGCGRIEITVQDARAEAQAFYRHMGYERSGIRYQKLF